MTVHRLNEATSFNSIFQFVIYQASYSFVVVWEGWSQRGSRTSVVRFAQVALKNNSLLIYIHMMLTVNGIFRS